METKKYIAVKSVSVMIHEDDFNLGEGDLVNEFTVHVKGEFASVDSALDAVADTLGYDIANDKWLSPDETGIDCGFWTDVEVDENNSFATADDMNKFRTGEKKLYSAHIAAYLVIREERPATVMHLVV